MTPTIHFRYRLVSDCPHEQMSVNGTALSKANWVTASTRIAALDSEIRRITNPRGYVEYEEFNAHRPDEIYYKPSLEGPETIYNREELLRMTLTSLRQVAERLGVRFAGKKPDALVRLIIEGQDRHVAANPQKKSVLPDLVFANPEE